MTPWKRTDERIGREMGEQGVMNDAPTDGRNSSSCPGNGSMHRQDGINHVPTEKIFVMKWSTGGEYRKLCRGKHKMKGKYDPERHHRHSIRLESYDYSQQGAYFVTICTQNRQCFFGNIVDGNVSFSDVGEMVLSQWKMLPERFAPVVLDEYVLMPNHLHGIIYLSSSEGEHTITPPNEWQPRTFQRPARNTLGEVVRSFKAATARLVRVAGYGDFAWQREYYEHIIRHEQDLERVRLYITNNPAHWSEDEFNPHLP